MQVLKKHIIICLCVALVVMIIPVWNAFTISADGTSSIACNTSLKVGETVTVTVNIKGGGSDLAVWGVEGALTFSASVLSYKSSSATTNVSGNTVKFAFSGSGGSSVSATFTFEAISAGTSDIKLGGCTYSGDAENSTYNVVASSVRITVNEASDDSTDTALWKYDDSDKSLTVFFLLSLRFQEMQIIFIILCLGVNIIPKLKLLLSKRVLLK